MQAHWDCIVYLVLKILSILLDNILDMSRICLRSIIFSFPSRPKTYRFKLLRYMIYPAGIRGRLKT